MELAEVGIALGTSPQAQGAVCVWIEFVGATWAPTEPVQKSLMLSTTAYKFREALCKDGIMPIPHATKIIFADHEIQDNETFLSHGVVAGATLTCVCVDGFSISVLLLDRRQAPFRLWSTERVSSMLERLIADLKQRELVPEEPADLDVIWFLYVPGAMSLIRLSPTAVTAQTPAEATVQQIPGLADGALIVMEQSRRELTEHPDSDFEWINERCKFDCCGVHAIGGKFLTPCGAAPEGKYRTLMGSFLFAGMLVMMFGLWQPCITSTPSTFSTIGYFVLLLPGMVLVALICCGNEFGEPTKALGPIRLVIAGMQPAVWWAAIVLLLATLAFCFLVMTDALFYKCTDSSSTIMNEKDSDSNEKNTLFDVAGYILGGGSFCMTCLSVKWIKTEHVLRLEESENYDYETGDWRLLGLIEAGMPAAGELTVGVAQQPRLPPGFSFNVADATQEQQRRQAGATQQQLEAPPYTAQPLHSHENPVQTQAARNVDGTPVHAQAPPYTARSPYSHENPMQVQAARNVDGLPVHAHDMRGSWRSPRSSGHISQPVPHNQ